MRIQEILSESELQELNLRKGLATAALTAMGALGSAQASDEPASRRITVDPNGQTNLSYAQQMAQHGIKPSSEKSTFMPNQDLEAAEKVVKTPDGIKITHGGKEYDAVEVPADTTMVPRGALKIKVQKSQMGLRSLGNYTAYLLPNGKAYIYSK